MELDNKHEKSAQVRHWAWESIQLSYVPAKFLFSLSVLFLIGFFKFAIMNLAGRINYRALPSVFDCNFHCSEMQPKAPRPRQPPGGIVQYDKAETTRLMAIAAPVVTWAVGIRQDRRH